MSAVLSSVLQTKPSAEEVAQAAPLRKQARETVLQRKEMFDKDYSTYMDAGLTYWQLRPLKTFLESELAWWNANIELTQQQVNTRNTSYVEQLQPLNKELQNNLTKAILALPKDKAQKILDILKSNQNSGNPEGFADTPTRSPALTLIAESAQKAQSTQKAQTAQPTQTAQTPTKTTPLNTTPTTPIDVSGGTATIDLASIQNKLSKDVSGTTITTPTETSWGDDINTALGYVLKTVGIIIYLCLALRIAAFVANDLIYKPVPYRILGFIYAFLFAPILFPYYIYREFAHRVWPQVEAPHFESILPITPYDPSDIITIQHRIYGYADTPQIRQWIETMQKTYHIAKSV